MGTEWVLSGTGSGIWTAPASGTYTLELHGGGGGGGAAISRRVDAYGSHTDYYAFGGDGGSSGLTIDVYLEAGVQYAYFVGSGGQGRASLSGTNGEGTTFGSWSILGGEGGKVWPYLPSNYNGSGMKYEGKGENGMSYGNMSSDGYGQGGKGSTRTVASGSSVAGGDGTNGIIYITFKG